MDWNILMHDFFESDGLETLLKDAGAMLRCPMLVVDVTFHIVSSYVPEGFHDAVFEAALMRGEITYEAISALNWDLIPDPTVGVFQLVEDSAYVRRFSALNSGGMRVGYLICVDVRGDLSLRPESDFRRLEAILAKQLFCLERRGDSYGTTVEEVLTHLLDGKFSGPGAFYTQAMTTQLAQYRPARLVLINLGLYRSLNFRDDMLKQDLHIACPGSHPFLYRDEVLLFLDDNQMTGELDRLAKQRRLRVVITEVFSDLYNLPQVYQAAQDVMQYLIIHVEGDFIAKTGQFRDLMRLRRLAERPDFMDPQIAEIADHDERHGTQFCLTLYTYCICHHSVKQTCERMFTHRNTILYRLRKLKEDFNLNLDEPDETMPLLLSSALALLRSHQDQLFVHGFPLRAENIDDMLETLTEQAEPGYGAKENACK